MSKEYVDDVARYASNVNENAVAGIVKHLGIALRSKDASLVSCSSKDELSRVRDSWLKKKLHRSEDDKKLDDVIKEICETMKADKRKNRVTFYYLLAEKFDQLELADVLMRSHKDLKAETWVSGRSDRHPILFPSPRGDERRRLQDLLCIA